MKKLLQTFDSFYFRGKSHYEEDNISTNVQIF